MLARQNGARRVHVLLVLRIGRTQIASFLKNLCASRRVPGGASLHVVAGSKETIRLRAGERV